MDLKKNEILQINSSIIVGVLILLTLGSTITHLHKVAISLITASIIVPFAVSSIMIIIAQPPETDEKNHSRNSFQNKKLKLHNGDDSRVCIYYISTNHGNFNCMKIIFRQFQMMSARSGIR